MISNPVWQCIFSIVFALLTTFFIYRAVSSKKGLAKVSFSLHAVMGFAMLAMAWPWWNSVPVRLQLAFFALATIWYLVLGTTALKKNNSANPNRAQAVIHQLAHAIMMASMAWMLWSMSGESFTHVHGDGTVHEHGSHSLMHEPAVYISGIIVTALLTIVTLWFLYRAVKSRKIADSNAALKLENKVGSRIDMIANSVMGAGMVCMNLLMYWPNALG